MNYLRAAKRDFNKVSNVYGKMDEIVENIEELKSRADFFFDGEFVYVKDIKTVFKVKE